MSRISRFLLVIAVVMLVIWGLNISGQGIDSLTAEESKPVIGWQVENKQVSVFALGEEYCIDCQDISWLESTAAQYIRQQCGEFCTYLQKIWTIFSVLFLK